MSLVDWIKIKIPTTYASHGFCLICKSKSGARTLHTLSCEAIIEVFIKTNIFIPQGARCCLNHLNDSKLVLDEELTNIKQARGECKVNAAYFLQLFQTIRERETKLGSLFCQFSSFDNFSNETCKRYTGFTKDEFFFIYNEIRTSNEFVLKKSSSRSVEQALAIYLYWLKTGMSQEGIAAQFRIKPRQRVSNICKQVRLTLLKNFVPKYLGARVFNRDTWLEKNSQVATVLFDLEENQLALIADGTYIYCQKSWNNLLHRQTFSAYKKRHFIKPFVICSTNGHIVDIYGPFSAETGDSEILSHVLKTDNELRDLLKPNDVFILDRGFRDVVSELEKYKFIPKIPTCVPLSQKQLKCSEANESRLVTKCRSVIEMVNGIFKQSFRSFEQTQNSMLKHIYQDFQISAALINCFYARNLTDRNNAVEIALKMKNKLRCKNELEDYLSKTSTRKNTFQEIEDSEITDFPVLSEEDIRMNITLGTYQIRQSHGYIAEHINKTGKYNLMIQAENKFTKKHNYRILNATIRSKNFKSKKYQVFIKYVPHKNGADAILGWVCDCKNGLRTVGCCSHVSSIIYYLGYFRKLENQKYASILKFVSPNPTDDNREEEDEDSISNDVSEDESIEVSDVDDEDDEEDEDVNNEDI